MGIVGGRGLEPPRVTPHAPKACASTNSAIRPSSLKYFRVLATPGSARRSSNMKIFERSLVTHPRLERGTPTLKV